MTPFERKIKSSTPVVGIIRDFVPKAKEGVRNYCQFLFLPGDTNNGERSHSEKVNKQTT